MILIFGPPGSGKTTQSKMLEAKCGLKWLGAGYLLRKNNDYSIKSQMMSGELLESHFVNSIMVDAIKKIDSSRMIIIDGYPRTIDQAKWLISSKADIKRNVMAIIVLAIDKEEIFVRLNQRHRIDDTPAVISKRIIMYNKDIIPILDYYQTLGVEIVKIEANSNPETVHNVIVSELKKNNIL